MDARVATGDRLPLAGLAAAVKDNIDVAGMPTTAGAASYSYLPEQDATSVARLRAAGAVVLGKTNLDQFATGLVGTRSPYGVVRNAWDSSPYLRRFQFRLRGRGRARPGRYRPRHRHRRIGPCPGSAQRHHRRQAHPRHHPGHRRRAGLPHPGLRHRLRPHPGPGTPDGGRAVRPGRPRPARPRVPGPLVPNPSRAATGAARGLRFRYLRSSRIWPTAGRTPSPLPSSGCA